MKASHLIPYLMTVAVITGCIKEDGEPYTIMREIQDNTLESSLKGYMYGTAEKDSITENTFHTLLKANGLEDLDVYISLASDYANIDINRNAIKQCGYVYSPTNKIPTVGGDSCKVFDQKNIKWDGDSTSTAFTFSGVQHGLKFNNNYFIRSYVVTTKGDTCYNPHVCQTKTVIPSNVWFKRNDASLDGRSEAITATTDGGQLYIYGGRGNTACYSDMWIYNSKNDTWEQKATFNPSDARSTAAPAERCNGAAFMFNSPNGDTLMYILGGEEFAGTPLKTNFIYSLKHNQYGSSSDHPQGRQYVEPFEQPRSGMVAFKITAPSGEVFHVVGLGRLYIEGTNTSSPESKLFIYDHTFDRLKMKTNDKGEDEDDGTHVHTWQHLGSMTKDGKTDNERNIIGFDEPVAFNINEKTVIIGTGEDSEGNYGKSFYRISMNNILEMELQKLPVPPDEFKPRKNAAGFYLKYVKEGAEYDRFFVGTGVDANGYPLNDFWAYEFSTMEWERIADCGNIYREGAIGFKTLRVDDYFVKEFAEPQERGIVAFGRGTLNSTDEASICKVRKDVWEYLP